MPLCTLEIPRGSQPDSDDLEKKNQACNEVLDTILGKLQIPDPDDREVRIVQTDVEKPRLVVSYTVGPNEYPGFVGDETFDPDEDLVRATAREVQETTGERLETSETRMEAHRYSTFILLPRDSVDNKPDTSEAVIDLSPKMKYSRLGLFLSPDVIESSKAGSVEAEPRSTDPLVKKLADNLMDCVDPLFEEKRVGAKIEVIRPVYADSDFSVEFDCVLDGESVLSEAEREALAEHIIAALEVNQLTKGERGEIWIRQGSAEVTTVTSASN